MLPQTMPLWSKNYFKLKAIKKQTQKELFAFLHLPKAGRKYPPVKVLLSFLPYQKSNSRY